MKKLMIAASAALCATVGFSDVTSANIVGYQNKATVEGNMLAGVAFNNIAEKTYRLSDVIPNGYQGIQDAIDQGGIQGEIIITLYDAWGDAAGDFYWNHMCKSKVWEPAGYWTGETYENYEGGEGLSADEVLLQPGNGFWVAFGFWENGCTLTVAGEPLMDACNVPTIEGNQLVSSPLAKAYKLGQIIPYGYEGIQDAIDQGGIQGEIIITLYDAWGDAAGDFYWNHMCKSKVWEPAGYWTGETYENYEGGEGLSASEVTVNPGDALWVAFGFWDDGCGLSFPGLDDEYADK